MRKRILASLLTLCMLLSLVPTAFATDTYGDVPPTHMFYDEITYVSENGLMNGIGNSKLNLIFGLLDGVVLRISLSYILGIALNLGLFGFFLGYALAAYGTSIPGIIYYLSGKWKNYRMLKAE